MAYAEMTPGDRGVFNFLRHASGPTPAVNAWDMRTISGLATPSTYRFEVPVSRGYMISAINFLIADEGLRVDQFGALGVLANGCQFRAARGAELPALLDFTNAVPITRLADLLAIAGTPLISSPGATGPEYVSITMRFRDLMGANLELQPGGVIEWINRDDLTGLDVFEAMVVGQWLR